MKKLSLTILMPCLNEEKTIGICIKKAKKFLVDNSIDGEILIADNGSSDSSVEIAEKLGARVINVVDRGYGNVLKEGIKEAHSDFIIYGDCDDSYDFSDIMEFYLKLKEGYYFINGNRYTKKMEKGAMSFSHRYIGVPFLSWLGRIFYKVPFKDYHCGLRAIKRIPNINFVSTGMEFASEIVYRYSLIDKNKMIEIPISFYKDKRGNKSHLRTIRDGLRHVVFIIKSVFFL